MLESWFRRGVLRKSWLPPGIRFGPPHLTRTVLLPASRERSAPPQTRAVWTAWLCVLVMLFAVTAEARHFHGNRSREAQRCGVCVAGHSPGLLAKTATVAPEKVAAAVLPTAEPVTRSLQPRFSLYVRPPPAA